MNMNTNDAPEITENVVYVKSVPISDLPEEIQEEARIHSGSSEILFGIFRPDGEQVALVSDRDVAFALARENDYTPVTLH